jgi:hypothetical protein
MRKLAGVHVIDVTDRSPDDVAGEIVALVRDPMSAASTEGAKARP